MYRELVRQPLASTAEPHVYCRNSDSQSFGNRVRVVVESVPERQYLAVSRGEFIKDRPKTGKLLLPLQLFQRKRLRGPHTTEHFRRLRPISPKRTLGVIFGEVTRHTQEPCSRGLNHLTRFPLFPQPKERLLRHIHRKVGIHPSTIGQRPDLAAVLLIQQLKLRPPGGAARVGSL